MISFILGFILGGFVGVTIMCLIIGGKDENIKK